jgi:LPS export ABC transporter protein LptC
MRGTRWLLLLAILAIVAGIGVTYQTQQRVLATHAPPKPAALPVKMDSLRHGFDYERTEAGRKKYRIISTTVSQEKDSSHVKLEEVELRLFDKTQDNYNLVKSATADYDQSASRMYSEGAVEMTLHVPVEGQPKRPLVQIKSSGVTFDTKSGQEFVSTDRETHFTFENGTGSAWAQPMIRPSTNCILRITPKLIGKRLLLMLRRSKSQPATRFTTNQKAPCG